MRRAARTDRNQPEIVAALEAVGASVVVLSAVGQGCPDLGVGYRDRNFFLEVKDGEKPPSARKLTPDQVVWHRTWKGQVCTVERINDALAAIGAPARATVERPKGKRWTRPV